jgi:uncharacterized protein
LGLQTNRFLTILFIVVLVSPIFFVAPSKAQIVETDWVDSIESYAYEVDVNTTAEIVVCVFPSLYGHGITDSSGNEINDIVKLGVYILNDYPLDVYDGTKTGIGKSGKDNGVLVLVAIEERQWRIEVGYGLEGDLTDAETNLIAQEYLVPAFQEGAYGEGLYYTVVALGEQVPSNNQTDASTARGYYYYESGNEPTQTSTPFWDWSFYGMPLWLIILLALLGVFVPVLGGRGRVGGGGRSGGGGSTGKW